MLGYKVFHDDEQMTCSDLYDVWSEGKIDDDEYHHQLGILGYNVSAKSTTLEWVQRHPHVKAILTVRDSPQMYADSWLVVAPLYKIVQKRPFCWFDTADNLVDNIYDEFLSEPTGGMPELWHDRDHLSATYVKYNKKATETLPADQVLVFNVKQGWEPLCSFLNVPIPDEPFPFANDRIKSKGEYFVLNLVTWVWPLPLLLPLVLLLRMNSFTILS